MQVPVKVKIPRLMKMKSEIGKQVHYEEKKAEKALERGACPTQVSSQTLIGDLSPKVKQRRVVKKD